MSSKIINLSYFSFIFSICSFTFLTFVSCLCNMSMLFILLIEEIMGNLTELNENNFDDEVIKAEQLTVVDFWAPWCGPCRKLTPVLEEIATEFEGKVKLAKVNTDENLKLAQRFSISALPSILIFKNGEPVERLVSLMPKSALITNITKHI